eukprot:5660504-Pleurochrysis_carterae.AAC.1
MISRLVATLPTAVNVLCTLARSPLTSTLHSTPQPRVTSSPSHRGRKHVGQCQQGRRKGRCPSRKDR